jgi:hypothetical protein
MVVWDGTDWFHLAEDRDRLKLLELLLSYRHMSNSTRNECGGRAVKLRRA